MLFANLKDKSWRQLHFYNFGGSSSDFPLRNAIGHGDYVIRKDLQVVFIPSATLDHIAGTNKRRTSQVRYSFKDIDKLYRKANGFQAAFKAQVREAWHCHWAEILSFQVR